MNRLLSGDLPRSRILAVVLLLVFLGLACAPFLTSGARPLNTAATICVYIVLVASYDLLLGYTGVVSFAHTMFYGIGAYGIGLGLASVDEPTWSAALPASAWPCCWRWRWPSSSACSPCAYAPSSMP